MNPKKIKINKIHMKRSMLYLFLNYRNSHLVLVSTDNKKKNKRHNPLSFSKGAYHVTSHCPDEEIEHDKHRSLSYVPSQSLSLTKVTPLLTFTTSFLSSRSLLQLLYEMKRSIQLSGKHLKCCHV